MVGSYFRSYCYLSMYGGDENYSCYMKCLVLWCLLTFLSSLLCGIQWHHIWATILSAWSYYSITQLVALIVVYGPSDHSFHVCSFPLRAGSCMLNFIHHNIRVAVGADFNLLRKARDKSKNLPNVSTGLIDLSNDWAADLELQELHRVRGRFA